MTRTDVWKAIAEGWRAVTFAEQAAGGGGGLESAASWLDDIELRLQGVGARLVSAQGVWLQERSEIEDLIFEIVYNARPHVQQAVVHYAGRNQSEAEVHGGVRADVDESVN